MAKTPQELENERIAAEEKRAIEAKQIQDKADGDIQKALAEAAEKDAEAARKIEADTVKAKSKELKAAKTPEQKKALSNLGEYLAKNPNQEFVWLNAAYEWHFMPIDGFEKTAAKDIIAQVGE